MKSTILKIICALLSLAVCACLGTSGPSMPTLPTAGTLTAGATSSAAQVQGGPIVSSAPSQIVVFPFATSTADVQLNQGMGARFYRDWEGEDQTADRAQLAQSTAHNICVEVASGLANKGWNAACQNRSTPVTGNNVLIIDGAFTDISAGNRLQRTVIGLGEGASGIDTQVGLYQYSNGNSTQLETFSTQATSGKMPGVAITAPAGAAAGGAAAAVTIGANVAAGGIKNITSATSYLGDQTAELIVARTNIYLSQQGWSPGAASS
jgi:hypothetical protein